MSHQTSYPTVYPNLNKSPDLVHRGNPKLLIHDVRAIIAVVGHTSIITHICQHAIKHAADYIRTHNLTVADYDAFGDYLRERSVVVTPPGQAASPNDSRRTTGGGKQTPAAARQRPVARKDAASGSGSGS